MATTSFLFPASSRLSISFRPRKPNPSRTHQWRKTITASSTSTKEALLAKNDLIYLISNEERGIKTEGNASNRSKIIKAIDAMAVLGKDSITTGSSLSATWRMLWTTEKEHLFIIKNAYLFGTQTGDVLQVIDVERGVLNNLVCRRFTSAVLRGENWEFPLPPFGQGWFESVYLGDEIRVVKDIREDYLVVDRAPYSWEE